MRTPVSVGIVGLGDFGAELARRFSELPDVELRWLCDTRLEPRLRLRATHRHVRVAAELAELLEDESLDAVAFAVPAEGQYELVRRALVADKHVLSREPMALVPDQAEELVRIAALGDRRLVPASFLAFHPAARKLKELIEVGRLGDIYYVHADSQYLDHERGAASVLWARAVQDVSLVLYLLGDDPVRASAWADCYVQDGVADVLACSLTFATGVSAVLNASWLTPQPVRRVTVVGSKRVAVLDALDLDRPLTIYEKGAPLRKPRSPLDRPARVGDIVSPRFANDDPLRLACEYFVAAVRAPGEPAEAARAAAVVRVIELLERAAAAGWQQAGDMPRAVGSRVIPLPVKSA